ncbi:hypothetical protein [Nocardia stercoris]|uniref:Uncharacterized protein n=1 Tax=Nocardia stercoris TaxID=2483361 RepID=A0A3M2L4S6_9NOCA|nr:hypothetical protein [Nocardia stercoris]RMI29528.1 hypothetical protein EBN03_26015 [Nocardia stercoris]
MFGESVATRTRRTLSAVCVAAALVVPAGLAATAAADPIAQADDVHGVYPRPWCPPQFGGWQPPPRFGGWQPPVFGGWEPPFYGGGYDDWYDGPQYPALPLIVLGSAALS